jgi:hypothetical protein
VNYGAGCLGIGSEQAGYGPSLGGAVDRDELALNDTLDWSRILSFVSRFWFLLDNLHWES